MSVIKKQKNTIEKKDTNETNCALSLSLKYSVNSLLEKINNLM